MIHSHATSVPAVPDVAADGKRVLPEAAAAQRLSLSYVQLRRLRRLGEAPPHVQLSSRRIGYRIADIDAWVEQRLCRSAVPAGA